MSATGVVAAGTATMGVATTAGAWVTAFVGVLSAFLTLLVVVFLTALATADLAVFAYTFLAIFIIFLLF